jgi:Domain of unknown function (DUF4326)
MTPRRFQRRRIKGYRLPPGIICVTHQTKWGNPHNWKTLGRSEAVRRHAAIEGQDPKYRAAARRELRGRNLACYCPLDQRCHADTLLRISNEPE